jgi:hypothetical protein
MLIFVVVTSLEKDLSVWKRQRWRDAPGNASCKTALSVKSLSEGKINKTLKSGKKL